MEIVKIGPYQVGQGHPLLVMAGPCVLEGYERSLAIGKRAKAICEKLGLPYVFKASYDKANRSSLDSFRGPGLEEGLQILAQIKKDLGVPVISDVHETWQADSGSVPAAHNAQLYGGAAGAGRYGPARLRCRGAQQDAADCVEHDNRSKKSQQCSPQRHGAGGRGAHHNAAQQEGRRYHEPAKFVLDEFPVHTVTSKGAGPAMADCRKFNNG